MAVSFKEGLLLYIDFPGQMQMFCSYQREASSRLTIPPNPQWAGEPKELATLSKQFLVDKVS